MAIPKFPSEAKLMYAGSTVNNGAFASTHTISLPKDLSILNRRGYASTYKGTPLVYRCAVTVYPSLLDGSGYTYAQAADTRTTVKIQGVQNNWVMKNAAVKFHDARELMFKKAGIPKKQRGAYSHEIRYNWYGANTSWSTPVDGDGAAFTGGTWDQSALAWAGDNSFQLTLTGGGDNEEADKFSGTHLHIGHSYLLHRMNQIADTNPQTEEGPAKFSLLQNMLSAGSLDYANNDDDVRGRARDEQDNPPYEVLDLSDSGDINHDITEPVELGRVVLTPGAGASQPQTVMVDLPFGIMNIMMANRDPDDNSGYTDALCVGVEVTHIYEMQG